VALQVSKKIAENGTWFSPNRPHKKNSLKKDWSRYLVDNNFDLVVNVNTKTADVIKDYSPCAHGGMTYWDENGVKQKRDCRKSCYGGSDHGKACSTDSECGNGYAKCWDESMCDLEALFDVDYAKSTAVMKKKYQKGSRNKAGNANGWKIIDQCTRMHQDRVKLDANAQVRLWKTKIRTHLTYLANKDSVHTGSNAFEKTLHGRLTQHFYETRFVAPFTSVGKNYKGMSHLFHTIKQNSIGNYRELVHLMFEDPTLRGSLNQAPVREDPQVALSGACKNADAPIENFGREMLELFSVGLNGHSYADIRILSQALNTSCHVYYKNQFEKKGVFVTGFGVKHFEEPKIFTNDKVWCTHNKKCREDIIDAIMNAHAPNSAVPYTAVYLCSTLTTEFLRIQHPQDSDDVVQKCAEAVYNSEWQILAGVRALVEHKDFRDSLGKGLVWPVNLVQGTIIDTGINFNSSTVGSWRRRMGQAFGYMPDVSGYDIFKLYGDAQLSESHKYLLSVTGCKKQIRKKKTIVKCGMRNSVSQQWRSGYYQKFLNTNKFSQAFDELEVNGQEDTYSYVTSRCDMSLFLKENGQEQTSIKTDDIFGSAIKNRNKKKLSMLRLNKFYSILKTNADNVCMLLA
jgi:uncharacterized protein (DUF1800 family)